MKVFLASVAAIALLGVASAMQLKPVDESGRDAELAALLKTLTTACERNDFTPFEAILAPDILGGNEAESPDGPAAFKAEWAIGAPDSPFCAEFNAAVKLGGAFGVDPDAPPTYSAPYINANWPVEIDPYNHIVAIGDETRLFDKGDGTGREITEITHQIVEVIPEPGLPQDVWVLVRTMDGQDEGYARRAETRSYLEPYARFEKRDGKWLLAAFLIPKG